MYFTSHKSNRTKYNFNNDKSTEEVFGFIEGDESWETLNNSGVWALWQSDDYSSDGWLSDYEARYPEDSTDATNLSALASWIVTTDQSKATGNALSSPYTDIDGVVHTVDNAAYRVAKFRTEASEHFEIDSLLFYYLFTELFLMVDSRAKNAFPSFLSGDKWCFLPYDFDTAIGIDNQGALAYGYSLEDIDRIGTENVFNGQNSVLWINVRAAFYNELASMYFTLRSNGALSYSVVESMFEEHQEKWAEAIFNEDAWFKYIDPLINDGTTDYLSMALGSKAEQRKWWLYNRFKYIDSKYSAGDTLTDYIMIRPGAVDSGITITPYADIYASIKWDNDIAMVRATRGQPSTLACPYSQVGNNVVSILNASQLASVGDLSGFKCRTANFSMATKLQSIKVGDNSASYENPNLLELNIGNNSLLRTVDARNCTSLATAIDLSGATNVEYVYFDGTAITSAVLPVGGIIKTLHLPDTITNLTIRNQPRITDFLLNNYSNITTLRMEDTPIDESPILLGMANNGRVRLLDVDWETTTYDEADAIFTKLSLSRGLDENGNNTENAQVSGDWYASTISDFTVEECEALYPSLNITYDILAPHKWLLNKYLLDEITEYSDDQLTQLGSYVLQNKHGTLYFPNCTMMKASALYGFNSDVNLRTAFPSLTTIQAFSALTNSNLTAIDSISLQTITEAGPITNASVGMGRNAKYIYLPNLVRSAMDAAFSAYLTSDGSLTEYIIIPKVTFSGSTSNAWEGYGFAARDNLQYVEFYGGNLSHVNCLRKTPSLAHMVIRDTTNLVTIAASYRDNNASITQGINGNPVNIYIARSLISSYQQATNWATHYANGYVTFKALEDYTVDGTTTGVFDYDKIGLEVYHVEQDNA